MSRVTEQQVREIIDDDTDISMQPFIDVAGVLTDRVESEDSENRLSSDELIQIEKWIAAHAYAIRDHQFASKSTGGASAQFQGQTGMRLEATLWGQMALALDCTGYLASLQSRRFRAGVAWLGLPPSEQTDYDDRD